MTDIATIKAAHPLIDSVRRYLGNGTRRGGREFWICPFHKEKTPSFSIVPGGGSYVCFGCGAAGDVLDFIAAKEGLDLKGAVAFLNGSAEPTATPPPTRKPKPDRQLQRRIAKAKRIWSEAKPIAGTWGATYLMERGLCGHFPPTLRFHHALDYFNGAGVSPLILPGLVAAVAVWPSHCVEGVQVTYLDPRRPRKAQVSTPRKSHGRIAGGAIRLASAEDHLLVGEGVETVLSAMLASGQPGWATAGTSGLRALVLPDAVKTVTIAADADAAGEQAAQAAADRWTGLGVKVRIARPPQGKDFNDALTGAAHG